MRLLNTNILSLDALKTICYLRFISYETALTLLKEIGLEPKQAVIIKYKASHHNHI